VKTIRSGAEYSKKIYDSERVVLPTMMMMMIMMMMMMMMMMMSSFPSLNEN
jgi:hypothetical protein